MGDHIEYEQRVQELIERLSALGELETYRGPRHPTEPNPGIATEIANFLETYPFLRQDQGYITFQEYYAGACAARFEESFWVEILGFSPPTTISLHLVKGEGDTVDEDGFLVFALVALGHDAEGRLIEDAYAYDATQQRPWGVYRLKSGSSSYQWYCESFLAWLERGEVYERHSR